MHACIVVLRFAFSILHGSGRAAKRGFFTALQLLLNINPRTYKWGKPGDKASAVALCSTKHILCLHFMN